jgi:glycosyltransferase involved in cell wall biosynthesis
MKISVITCTWNSIKTIQETIASVKGQDYPLVEHIFVDGGSTDGTLELIAQQCPDAFVLRDVSGGISRAMNAGIEIATGDIVAHLHSDDYYIDHKVLSLVFETFKDNPQNKWAYGHIRVLNDGELSPVLSSHNPFAFRRYAAGRTSVPHPAVFIRRELFSTHGGFDETLKYAMDIDLWLRLGRLNLPVQINASLTVFREHAGSVSTTNKLKARQEEWQVRRRYFSLAPFETAICGLRLLKRTARIRREMERKK